MKAKNLLFFFLIILHFAGCKSSGEGQSESISNDEENSEVIDGVYFEEYDDGTSTEFIISNETWFCKSVPFLNLDGTPHEQHSSGKVIGNELYHESGVVKIGYVSDGLLYTDRGSYPKVR